MEWVRSGSKPIAILTGSAGTGKTTLLKSLIKELCDSRIDFRLTAPTGRASRILEKKTETIAKTIHSEIYDLLDVVPRSSQYDASGFSIQFPLKSITPDSTIFIVDEASMVDDGSSQDDGPLYGTGSLIRDLLTYSQVATPGEGNSKILFVGDSFQLPPVGWDLSPALDKNYLLSIIGIESESFRLEKIQRQAEDSPVLKNAVEIRRRISENDFTNFRIEDDGEKITRITGIEAIRSELQNFSPEQSIIITSSNRAALSYNWTMRENRYGAHDMPIQIGDILLVCKNSNRHNLFNGDLVEVVAAETDRECIAESILGNSEEIKLYYRNIMVKSLGDERENAGVRCKVLENLLNSSGTGLSVNERQAIKTNFRRRNPSLEIGSSNFKFGLLNDEYYNAVEVRFGYAITCHKAQGGEWNKVTVEIDDHNLNYDRFNWAYTAITRSKNILQLVEPVEG